MKVKELPFKPLRLARKYWCYWQKTKRKAKSFITTLSIDAYRFKKEISENKQDLDGLSTGYLDAQSKLSWNAQILPLPKWFDQN